MSYRIRLDYFITETFANLKHNGLMTLASISAVAVAMLIMGTFLLINMNFNASLERVARETEIIVYLREDAGRDNVDVLIRLVKGLESVTDVRYVSVEEARARFKGQIGDQANLGNLVDTAPLPASLEIQVADTTRISHIVSVLDGQPAIDEIQYGSDVVARLNLIRKVVQIGGLGAVLLLCAVTIFVIANTIRLTVFARRKEIRIMQLVGATDWFIKWPFIIEGIFHGFIGSLLSVSSVALLYAWLTQNWPLPFMPLVADERSLMIVYASLLAGGMIVGALGSFFSVRKFLRTA